MSRLGTSVFSAAMARRLAKECLAALGALSIAVGIAAAALPDLVSADWRFVIALAIAAVVIGVVRAWPKRSFAVSFAHPSTTIAVKVGNLFNEEGDLVIGFSDTFDTEVGEVVSARSIQGQFLAQVYHNDRERLDRELGAALHDHSGVADPSKTKGKTLRYPLGTTVALNGEGRRFFCCGYTALHSTTYEAGADINTIWVALAKLWDVVRIKGEQRPIAMPVVGGAFARVTGSSCAILIRLILLSYFIHSRVKRISSELTVVISEADLEHVNLVEIEEFARTLNC
jgi:hypothetical protein